MTATETLEDKLRNQFNSIQAVGQISTAAGEELLNTSGDRELRLQSSLLIDAFGKVDRLSRSLKLGPIHQVIFNRSAGSTSEAATEAARSRNADSVVQSKVVLHSTNNKNKASRTSESDEDEEHEEDDDDDERDNFVFTSTVAPNLQNALLGDVIIRKTTERALVGWKCGLLVSLPSLPSLASRHPHHHHYYFYHFHYFYHISL